MKKILLVFALILTLCAACFAFTACGDDTEKNEISFKTLEVNGTDVYGRVSKDTASFGFINEIATSGKAKYTVALDIYGMQTVATKTVALNPGDNTFYVIETIDDDVTAVYTVVIHRIEVYEVSFVAEDVIAAETQYIEEGFFATAPTTNVTTRLGYEFLGWDFDFAKPVTGDVVVKAKIEQKEEMKIFEFTSTTTSCEITGLKDKTVTELVIPDYVTSIGEDAFYNCDSLTSVTIGNSVKTIGEGAFEGCDKLVEVINHSSLNINAGSSSNGYVGYYAKEVHKGESKIVNYNDYLFYTYNGVNYLLGYVGEDTVLVLPESYKGENYEIYNYAFLRRKDITSVVISSGVIGIGDRAFAYCDSLTSITVSEGNKTFSSINGNLYSKDGKILIQYAIGKTDTSFVIPDSVTSIGYYAFSGCTSLTSVTIPNSVTSIGKYAFFYCRSLTSVTIGNSVTGIGDYAFADCTSLTSVTIGNSVTSIGVMAFYECTSLTSVTIPDSVTSIDMLAFRDCTSLKSVIIPNSVTSIDMWAFRDCTSLTIYCEAASEPSGWDYYWNYSGCPVVWGYKV